MAGSGTTLPLIPLSEFAKPAQVMTAVARELLGFIWAIAIKAEAGCRQPMAA